MCGGRFRRGSRKLPQTERPEGWPSNRGGWRSSEASPQILPTQDDGEEDQREFGEALTRGKLGHDSAYEDLGATGSGSASITVSLSRDRERARRNRSTDGASGPLTDGNPAESSAPSA